jgi:intracellular sulfur oxidation DsrE/DsrF family protein
MKKICITWLFPALLAVAWGSTQLAPVFAAETPADSGAIRAVVHVNFGDAERQGKGLKNIANILKEVGDKAQLEVVAHGPGIDLLIASKTKHAGQVAELSGHGVRFVACENTLAEKSIPKGDLIEGVGTVPSGAVEVIRKQHEGYAYFRP